LNATNAEHLKLTADDQQDKGSAGVQPALEVEISIGNRTISKTREALWFSHQWK